MARSIIALTPGDPDGIGPEVTWKAIRSGVAEKFGASLLCVGAAEPFRKLRAPIIEARESDLHRGTVPPHRKTPAIWLLPAPERSTKFLPGFQSGWSIEHATQLVQSGVASALVTGPISKERLNRGGFPFPGHTEFLADLCGIKGAAQEPTMMLANDQLRVSLVTIHMALKDVPRALTRERLRRAIVHTVDHLSRWWGIRRPRVAVASLNPHAGEAGLFGHEEERIITPEVKALQKKYGARCVLTGPLPADTLFAKHYLAKPADKFDAVVCMYHDQGLIPVKLLDFPRTVNVTLGLPIVRTSVDHGVGFDIAHQNKADPTSLKSAIQLASQIAKKIR